MKGFELRRRIVWSSWRLPCEMVEMVMEDLISIIIPVYNVEPYLCQCLDSVIGQTYENLEILIIDDGSTDGSGKICDKYAERDERIRVFHTENRGLSAARNMGLDESNGKYIAFIDSDDWFELDAIERSVEAVSKSKVDIVCFHSIREYKNSSKKDKIDPREPVIFSDKEIIKEYCTNSGVGAACWNKLYGAGLFQHVRYPEGRYYEDRATTYQLLLLADRVECIPYVLIHYRARKDSITSHHDYKNIDDHWWASRKCFDDIAAISKDLCFTQLASCTNSISRMWRWYLGFSGDEKKRAKITINSMQQFVAEYRKEIMRDSNISVSEKVLSICSITTNPVMMSFLYYTNQVIRKFQVKEEY